MIFEKIPEIIENDFDKDSLVYENDTHIYYGKELCQNIIEDLTNKKIQVYGGYYEYIRGKKSPTIYLLCRGIKSGKVKIKVENFKPYCYVSDTNGSYKTYLGESCEKMIFESSHPSRVKIFRDVRYKKGYSLAHEADILFVRRFLCDVYDIFKPDEPIKPSVAILDIETNHPVSEDIISYSINGMEGDIVYDSKFNSNNLIMALDILKEIDKYDWITGWNIDFDRNILNQQLLDIKGLIDDIYKIGTIYTKEELSSIYSTNPKYKGKIDSIIDYLILEGYLIENTDMKISLGKPFLYSMEHHVSIIDLLEISKKMYGQEIRGNWTLGNVGHRLCGINKALTGNRHIRDLPEEELFEYNVIDTIIPEIVDNLLGGLEAHLMLAWSLQAMIEDVQITAVVNDIALIRAYHRAGIVLPSRNYAKSDSDENEPKYKAAEPDAKPGIYKGIIATDLQHAYPFAVISKNISPETKDLLGQNETPNGIRFNNNKSVFIDTLKEIMTERSKAKAMMKSLPKGSQEWRKYKYIDFALKTQAAAFSHGIFGWSNSRMVDYEVADAITAVVRELLNKIKDSCNIVGREWVYCHTDSVYINAPVEEKEKILSYLNNQIREYCEGYLVQPNLDFKNYYPIGYIHAKSRNVLVPEDGSIDNPDTWDVTGMDFMRSETPEPIGDIETKIISLFFAGKTKPEIIEEVRKMIKELVSMDTTLLGTSKPLKKPISNYGKVTKTGTIGGIPYHIKALQRATAEYGFQVSIGDKFMIIPIITEETEGVKKIRRKRVFIAYSPETGLPDKYRIDFESYLRSNLWGKVCPLFNLRSKELEKEVINEDVIMCLFSEFL
jgi:DNA polymerase elongation subunit (family B)